MDTTLGVTLDMMIAHGAAVMRGSRRAMVVVDLPFASYQESKEQAFRNAARVLDETGCAAVKLEGGREMAETIRFLAERGVPVMAHIGLKPQAVHAAGGFRAQGRAEAEAAQIRDDALAVDQAGAFAVVVDGQVLVTEDVLGLFSDFTPKFVKRYADLSVPIAEAAAAYAAEVKSRAFPGPEHCFGLPKAPKP